MSELNEIRPAHRITHVKQEHGGKKQKKQIKNRKAKENSGKKSSDNEKNKVDEYI